MLDKTSWLWTKQPPDPRKEELRKLTDSLFSLIEFNECTSSNCDLSFADGKGRLDFNMGAGDPQNKIWQTSLLKHLKDSQINAQIMTVGTSRSYEIITLPFTEEELKQWVSSQAPTCSLL